MEFLPIEWWAVVTPQLSGIPKADIILSNAGMTALWPVEVIISTAGKREHKHCTTRRYSPPNPGTGPYRSTLNEDHGSAGKGILFSGSLCVLSSSSLTWKALFNNLCDLTVYSRKPETRLKVLLAFYYSLVAFMRVLPLSVVAVSE